MRHILQKLWDGLTYLTSTDSRLLFTVGTMLLIAAGALFLIELSR